MLAMFTMFGHVILTNVHCVILSPVIFTRASCVAWKQLDKVINTALWQIGGARGWGYGSSIGLTRLTFSSKFMTFAQLLLQTTGYFVVRFANTAENMCELSRLTVHTSVCE